MTGWQAEILAERDAVDFVELGCGGGQGNGRYRPGRHRIRRRRRLLDGTAPPRDPVTKRLRRGRPVRRRRRGGVAVGRRRVRRGVLGVRLLHDRRDRSGARGSTPYPSRGRPSHFPGPHPSTNCSTRRRWNSNTAITRTDHGERVRRRATRRHPSSSTGASVNSTTPPVDAGFTVKEITETPDSDDPSDYDDDGAVRLRN